MDLGVWPAEKMMGRADSTARGREKPVKRPLAHRTPAETSRALPNNRGFPRALPGGKSPQAAPTPEALTPAPVAPVVVPEVDAGQLTIWDYQPRPAKPLLAPGTQLSLFEEEL